MKEEQIEVLKKAIDSLGNEFQMNIAIEELSELIKEICKYFRYGDNEDKIAEEMADVEIMLYQLKMIFNNNDLVNKVKDQKIERLKNKLND